MSKICLGRLKFFWWKGSSWNRPLKVDKSQEEPSKQRWSKIQDGASSQVFAHILYLNMISLIWATKKISTSTLRYVVMRNSLALISLKIQTKSLKILCNTISEENNTLCCQQLTEICTNAWHKFNLIGTIVCKICKMIYHIFP